MRADRLYPMALMVWFFAAYALGDAGFFTALEPPAPQMMIFTLTVLLLANSLALPGFRRWLVDLDLRRLIAVHVLRFVGIYFLILHGRGQLPYDFAVKGGWGDILTASGALALVIVPGLVARRGLVLAWNVFGLIDIAFVVTTAARLGSADPSSMRALLRLPLSLLLSFFVPLVIATHLWIFWRVYRNDPGGRPPLNQVGR
ncbi:MAG: hypothetical protein ABI080_07810 [Candidatus Binatia bacterium]